MRVTPDWANAVKRRVVLQLFAQRFGPRFGKELARDYLSQGREFVLARALDATVATTLTVHVLLRYGVQSEPHQPLQLSAGEMATVTKAEEECLSRLQNLNVTETLHPNPQDNTDVIALTHEAYVLAEELELCAIRSIRRASPSPHPVHKAAG